MKWSPGLHRSLLPHVSRLLPFALCLSGCAPYSDFSLPPPADSSSASSFDWQPQPEPVLSRGASGEWDSVDVLNPSVVRHKGTYFNFYSGFDGKTWHTGLATSLDGIQWTRQGKILSPGPREWEGDSIAANGSALRVGGEFYYWYQAGRPPRIGLARSLDGRQWRKQPNPVLATGPRGSWDERGVADPYAIRTNEFFYLFYLGQDRARRQRLGVARSRDGVNWEKLRANPVLELGAPGSFDENGLGEPAVWSSHGSWWMLYTGRDRKEHRRIGLARSSNGIAWRKVEETPAFQGDQPWNARVVCDPSVEVIGAEIRVWFGGGDRPSPDERLNGQIGLAILRLR
jgi:predicted GH43/DUF377 family glycosyl hydrolase